MKKLNKKLQKLMTINKNGQLECYLDSLNPEIIGNYLHLMAVKKRMIIAESFNKIFQLERAIEEVKKLNDSFNIRLNWLKDDLNEVIIKRQLNLKFWEEIEKKFKKQQRANQEKRQKRIKKNNV